MRIDLPPIPIEVKAACQFICTQTSRWASYSVKLMDKASLYLQNPWLAGLALVVMNVVFFEAALAGCRLVHRVVNQNASDEAEPVSERNAHAFTLGVVFMATLGAANLAFCKMLRLPLSKWRVIAICLPTGLFYLILKTSD